MRLRTHAVSLLILFITVILGCLLFLSVLDSVPGADGPPDPRSALLDEILSRAGSSAVMITRGGKVIFEYGDVDRPYQCHSIRKPFLGALYGIAVSEGRIDIDATLHELGIEDNPSPLTPFEKTATIRNLLMSRSGVYHQAAAESRKMAQTRPDRGSHEPGSFFYYNNWDFNVLGTIYEDMTGEDIFTSFLENIAIPIGMEDFSQEQCSHVYERSKSLHPAYCFRMSTRDMARFGQLYLDGGIYEGRTIVPYDWIVESTQPDPADMEGDPYGYLWFSICDDSEWAPGFYHSGFGGHLLAVLEDQGIVAVHRVDTDAGESKPLSDVVEVMDVVLRTVLNVSGP